MLRLLDTPAILHTRSSLEERGYNHWVLFAGVEKGHARIIDGAGPIMLVGFDELAARWDGVGLIVSKNEISLLKFKFYEFLYIGSLCLPGFLALMALKYVHGKWCQRPKLSRGLYLYAVDVLMLLSITAVIGAALATFSPGSGLYHRPAITAIQKRQISAMIPKISAEAARKLLGNRAALFVDARWPVDFGSGHIPGAVNDPPDSSEEGCRASLGSIPADSPIVVYCQSNGCPYSGIVAGKLYSSGFRNLMLFEDGWLGWRSAEAEALRRAEVEIGRPRRN